MWKMAIKLVCLYTLYLFIKPYHLHITSSSAVNSKTPALAQWQDEPAKIEYVNKKVNVFSCLPFDGSACAEKGR